MIMALIPAIAGIIGKVVDKAIPDADKAADIKAALNKQLYTMSATELQGAIDIVKSEASGTGLKSWWRPIVMLTFTGMLVAWWFGFTPDRATPELMTQLFDIIKIGLGGYVVGRSGEKIAQIMRDKKG
jgi:hypothetical protein